MCCLWIEIFLLFTPGGLFHIPDHLSPAAASLTSSMLNVDPVKRATIQQIK
jgi:hypothetical protein